MAYTTVADVKAYLGITSADDDALISALIDAAQAYIERRTGRKFQLTSTSMAYHALDYHKFVHGNELWFDDDVAAFYETYPPVNYPISVAPGNDSVLPIDDAVTLPQNSAPYYGLRLLPRASVTWYDLVSDAGNNDNIYLQAYWGYSQTPPDDIVHACKRLAAYCYRQKDAQVFDVTAMPDVGAILTPQGVPKDVEMILTPYIRRL